MSKESGGEQAEVCTLTDLEQVKALADPLRVRILEALCLEERTTKQVAQELGEKPTRLYHHVEALERVGLIRLTRTQQNRGTIEKYFQAVARKFRADPSLFSPADEAESAGPIAEVIASMMDRTTGELVRLARAGHDVSSGTDSLVLFTEVRADEEDIEKIRTKLNELVEELEALGAGEMPPEPHRRYRLNIAYFPIDVAESTDEG